MTATRRAAALISAATLLAWGTGIAGASAADESGMPSPAPESTSGDDLQTLNPDWDAPETVDTYVGQSVQVRKNADGFQNSDLANFRWTVTQVNAESLNGLDVSVPLPMSNAPHLRSLTGRSNMPTEVDGGVLYSFDDVDGIQTKRTLNLWPQDEPLPVDVTAEFTLNGEPVTADQIVGKGGLVTATYTIVNNTVESQDVAFTNVKGEEDTDEVETSQAFVGISKQFIPQSWAQFDPGHGIFGADGRGNFQTQWITLAFLPFAEGGTASFGWSAVIPDGEGFIPKMVIEVSPLYVPPHAAEEEEGDAAAKNGVPQPNVDSEMASVQSGVEDLVDGLDSLSNTIGAATGATKEGISIAVSQIKAAVNELCAPELLDCAAPEPEDPLELSEVIAALDSTIAAINAYVADSQGSTDPKLLVDYLDRIEEDVTEARTQAGAAIEDSQQAIERHQAGIDLNEAAKTKNEAALTLQQAAYDRICAVQLNPPVDVVTESCGDIQKAIDETEAAIADNDQAIERHQAGITLNQAAIAKNELVVQAADRALKAVNDAQAYVDENIGKLSTEKLRDLGEKLTGINDTLKGIQAQIDLLAPPLADLQAGLDGIGAAIDAGGAILGDVGSSLDQIASGRAQISAGLGKAGDEVSAYIADMVALAQATAEEGKETAAEVEAQANVVKAEMAGLKGRMAESPLPYGGGMNTVYAPAGSAETVQTEATSIVSDTGTVEAEGVQPTTELFGAYQFMLDPADSNQSNTPWRILLAAVFVVGAGLVGTWAAKRART